MCSTPFDTGGAVVVDEGADELLPDPPIAVLLPPQAAATTRIAAGARRRTRNRGMGGTLGVPRGARAIRAERATWTSPAPKRAGGHGVADPLNLIRVMPAKGAIWATTLPWCSRVAIRHRRRSRLTSPPTRSSSPPIQGS